MKKFTFSGSRQPPLKRGPRSVKERLNVSPDDGVGLLLMLVSRVLHRLSLFLSSSSPLPVHDTFSPSSFSPPSLKLSFLFNFWGSRVPQLLRRSSSSLEFRTEKQLQLLTQELDLTTGCPPQIGEGASERRSEESERRKGSRCGRSSLSFHSLSSDNVKLEAQKVGPNADDSMISR